MTQRSAGIAKVGYAALAPYAGSTEKAKRGSRDSVSLARGRDT